MGYQRYKVFKIVFEKARLTKNYDAVIHFAGLKLVEESLENYLKYSDFNVGGSLNFIKFWINMNLESYGI